MIQISLMITHAIKGKDGGTRANAISPVAATRILRRSVKPGTFTLEQIVPSVAHLASRDYDLYNVLLKKANNSFTQMNVQKTEPWEISGTGLTPQAIGGWLK